MHLWELVFKKAKLNVPFTVSEWNSQFPTGHTDLLKVSVEVLIRRMCLEKLEVDEDVYLLKQDKPECNQARNKRLKVSSPFGHLSGKVEAAKAKLKRYQLVQNKQKVTFRSCRLLN
jgi:hypothetical protein